MPELPDVETFKQYFQKTSLNQPIKKADVENKKILADTSGSNLKKELEEKKFDEAKRYGKYFFASIKNSSWLLFHFGMTGELKYFKNLEDKPSHSRLLITFENGYHLSFDCQRMLGKIDLIQNIKEFTKKKELGPDALKINLDEFKKRMQNKRGGIKSALMDQKTIAGIGNTYSDEILFQVGIHPKEKVKNLDEKNLEKMFNKMKKILETTIDKKADPEKFPSSYLIPERKKNGKCPIHNIDLQRIKVIGRTAYYCPKHQQKK